MSRCFPYPPPGYVRGETSLAESIKLQKVKEQEKEKKEKKREHKKDKKRSRASYEQTTDEKQIQKKRHIHKETKTDHKGQSLQDGNAKFLSDGKAHFLPDRKVQFSPEEQLEKSGLTEELGQPHQPYQCGSPDSSASEDSSKRRRIGDRQKTPTQATGLRIRFALTKPKTPDVAPVAPSNILRLPVSAPAASQVVVPPAAIQPSLGAPGPTLAPVNKIPEVVPRPSTSKEPEVAPESSERPSFSGRTEASTNRQLTAPDGSGLQEGYRGSKKSRKREAKFNDLFLNWTPPPLLEQVCLEVEDDDWLSNSSRRPRQAQHQTGTSLDRSTSSGQPPLADSLCSWPPRACHLEDADVYALPYVVPF